MQSLYMVWKKRVCVFFVCVMGNGFQVSLYGGQVVSWKNERREQLLYMSTKVQNLPNPIFSTKYLSWLHFNIFTF